MSFPVDWEYFFPEDEPKEKHEEDLQEEPVEELEAEGNFVVIEVTKFGVGEMEVSKQAISMSLEHSPYVDAFDDSAPDSTCCSVVRTG